MEVFESSGEKILVGKKKLHGEDEKPLSEEEICKWVEEIDL